MAVWSLSYSVETSHLRPCISNYGRLLITALVSRKDCKWRQAFGW